MEQNTGNQLDQTPGNNAPDQNIPVTELNERQISAVELTEGRIRIVAGAGSGKTRVIAHRYAYLVNQLGIDPGNILCTTFTNKAAREMATRIARMVPGGNVNDFVCTIHGFCVKFLRQEIFRIGFPDSFKIIDEDDAKALALEVMEDLGLERDQTTAQHILKEVGNAKGAMREQYVYRYLADPHGNTPLRDSTFAVFIQKQIKLFALDFDDLIFTTLYILKSFPDALDRWQQSLNYIMVDEAQDLSKVQWELIEMLAAGLGNLFIVGDPDQAIYEWRGAKPKLFVDFEADQTIVLDQNYRSTPQILDAANAVIANNKMRIPKDLFSHLPQGPKITHIHAQNDTKEADEVVRSIDSLIKSGEAQAAEFAVLMRAAYLSRSIEQALVRRGIKYTMWGGVRFYERREIKDALAYLQLIVNPDDDIAWRRIINVPSRKLGKAFVDTVKQIAAQESTSYFQAMRTHLGQGHLARQSAAKFVALILEARELMAHMTISELLDHMITASGLKAEIRLSGDEDRLDNLAELINAVSDYENENREDLPTPRKYLQDIALYTNTERRRDDDSVKLMTIHQAKGLEFPHVYIIGASEGILPSYRAIRERGIEAEEEERRLMYVAITRAMRRLTISESEGFISSLNSSKYPSRFITEIGSDLLLTQGEIPDELKNGADALHRALLPHLHSAPVTQFKSGDKVTHKIFGTGTIIQVRNNGATCLVRFSVGPRTIKSSFLTPK